MQEGRYKCLACERRRPRTGPCWFGPLNPPDAGGTGVLTVTSTDQARDAFVKHAEASGLRATLLPPYLTQDGLTGHLILIHKEHHTDRVYVAFEMRGESLDKGTPAVPAVLVGGSDLGIRSTQYLTRTAGWLERTLARAKLVGNF